MNVAKVEKYILDGYEEYEHKKDRTVKEYIFFEIFRQCFFTVSFFALALAILLYALPYIRHINIYIYTLLLLALVISITIIMSVKSCNKELNAIDERVEKGEGDTSGNKSITSRFVLALGGAVLYYITIINDADMLFAVGIAGSLAWFGVGFLETVCSYFYKRHLMRKYCPQLADYGGKNIEWPDEGGAEDK